MGSHMSGCRRQASLDRQVPNGRHLLALHYFLATITTPNTKYQYSSTATTAKSHQIPPTNNNNDRTPRPPAHKRPTLRRPRPPRTPLRLLRPQHALPSLHTHLPGRNPDGLHHRDVPRGRNLRVLQSTAENQDGGLPVRAEA